MTTLYLWTGIDRILRNWSEQNFKQVQPSFTEMNFDFLFLCRRRQPPKPSFQSHYQQPAQQQQQPQPPMFQPTPPPASQVLYRIYWSSFWKIFHWLWLVFIGVFLLRVSIEWRLKMYLARPWYSSLLDLGSFLRALHRNGPNEQNMIKITILQPQCVQRMLLFMRPCCGRVTTSIAFTGSVSRCRSSPTATRAAATVNRRSSHRRTRPTTRTTRRHRRRRRRHPAGRRRHRPRPAGRRRRRRRRFRPPRRRHLRPRLRPWHRRPLHRPAPAACRRAPACRWVSAAASTCRTRACTAARRRAPSSRPTRTATRPTFRLIRSPSTRSFPPWSSRRRRPTRWRFLLCFYLTWRVNIKRTDFLDHGGGDHKGLMIEQKHFFYFHHLPMYPMQLEKYIPFRFSRFWTVKKRMARICFFRPCRIPLIIDHAPKISHSYLLWVN